MTSSTSVGDFFPLPGSQGGLSLALIYGPEFDDEGHTVNFTKRGDVAMANSGEKTNAC